jgi:hypothetical protein
MKPLISFALAILLVIPTFSKDKPKPDPFQTLIGTSIGDYLIKSQSPTQIADTEEGTKIYTWQWHEVSSSTVYYPGTPVNVGTVGQSRIIHLGPGASTYTNTARYWLNLSVNDGKIIKCSYHLPKWTIKKLQKEAEHR